MFRIEEPEMGAPVIDGIYTPGAQHTDPESNFPNSSNTGRNKYN